MLTNSGSEPCTLAGGPASITAAGQNGIQVTLATTYDSGDGSLVGPANLEPGQSGQVALSTSAQCSDPETPVTDSSVSVGLPGDGGSVTIDLSGGLQLDAGCGVGASQFGTMQPTTPASTSPLGELTVVSTMPDTLTAGETATYQVTISNPAGQDVQLSPCPSYGEFLAPSGSVPRTVTSWHFLNCQDASVIPAGGSVTFQMQIAVPDATGEAKFGWLLAGTNVNTGHDVMISDLNSGE